jgi:hypothetical protein
MPSGWQRQPGPERPGPDERLMRAAAALLAHLYASAGYGYFRDEFYFIAKVPPSNCGCRAVNVALAIP